jgi:hypothetical protein
VIPRCSAAWITGASRGTPGDLITVLIPRPSSRPTPSPPTCASISPSALASGEPESVPITVSPRSASMSAAAIPDRARPTTRYGPGGSGGRVT